MFSKSKSIIIVVHHLKVGVKNIRIIEKLFSFKYTHTVTHIWQKPRP